MEHRWHPRINLNSIVTLCVNPSGTIKARVKNISRNGMLLETHRWNLAKGRVLEVICPALENAKSSIDRLKAVTIHATGGLAGILFFDYAGDILALWSDSRHVETADSGVIPWNSKTQNGLFGHAAESAFA